MNKPENNEAAERASGSLKRRGYAAFIDRGSGWEQCTCEMSRDDARIYVRLRRRQEEAYPMGKRFKTDKVRRHNAQAHLPAPAETVNRKADTI